MSEAITFCVNRPRLLDDDHPTGRDKCDPNILTPTLGTPYAAGFDLRADIVRRAYFEFGCVPELIPTGVRVAIPKDHVGLLTLRSSLAKEGLIMPNSPGIIDSDYRGEIGVLISNVAAPRHFIRPLDRIAQLVVVSLSGHAHAGFECVNVAFVDELDDTERGEGGFGSTGRD